MYGVNPAPASSHARFAEKLSLPFPLLVDPGGRVAWGYRSGFWRIVRRTVYVISPDGTIVAAWRGDPPVDAVLRALGRTTPE